MAIKATAVCEHADEHSTLLETYEAEGSAWQAVRTVGDAMLNQHQLKHGLNGNEPWRCPVCGEPLDHIYFEGETERDQVIVEVAQDIDFEGL